MNRKQRRSAIRARHGNAGPATQTETGEARTLFSAALGHLKAGRPAESTALCDRIIDRYPSFAQAYHLKGLALSRMGRGTEAVEHLRRAVKMRPDVVEAHSDLGVALDAQGDLAGAAACYREAIRLKRDHAEAHCNLGFVLLRQGMLDDAIAACRRAIAVKPALPEAYNNLALAFIGQDRPHDAVAAGRQAIELRPDFTEALNNLGTALRDLGEFDDAIASYRRALEIRPDYADAHYNLAFTYEKWNRLGDARAAAEAGLRANPEHPGINLVTAVCERRAGNTREALERLSRISFDTASPVVRRAAQFELGQLCDRLDDAAAAFSHFSAAKRSQAETWKARNVDKEMWFREIDVAAKRFTAEWVQSWTPTALPESARSPIFVIGFPRSATTLLGRILDGHPRLHTAVEQPTVAALLAEVGHLPSGYPDALANLDTDQMDRLKTAYFTQVDKCVDRRPETTIVDELPLNTIRAGLIGRIFPDARFLFSVRHPCDVCLSCFMQNFEINEAMANFLTIEGAAAFYARVMRLWQQYVGVLKLDVHQVRYEDLVENDEVEVRRVLDFVGVDWDSAVLDFAENPGSGVKIKTASYSQVAEPIYQRAKYRWRKYENELRPVMKTLAPFIEYFGYEES